MRIVNNAIVFQPAIAEDSGSYSCMRPDTLESIRAQLYVNGDGKFQCACSFRHIVLFCWSFLDGLLLFCCCCCCSGGWSGGREFFVFYRKKDDKLNSGLF